MSRWLIAGGLTVAVLLVGAAAVVLGLLVRGEEQSASPQEVARQIVDDYFEETIDDRNCPLWDTHPQLIVDLFMAEAWPEVEDVMKEYGVSEGVWERWIIDNWNEMCRFWAPAR